MEPKSKVADLGETVKFTCRSMSKAVWEFEGSALPDKSITGRMKIPKIEWLIIPTVDLNNAGVYTCYSEETENLVFMDYGVLIVNGMLYYFN